MVHDASDSHPYLELKIRGHALTCKIPGIKVICILTLTMYMQCDSDLYSLGCGKYSQVKMGNSKNRSQIVIFCLLNAVKKNLMFEVLVTNSG